MSLVGRLEDIALADIFQILSVGKKTGTLIIKASSGFALIVFKQGLVVRAEGNFIDKTLSEDLFDSGHVKSRSILELALKVKKDMVGKSITQVLMEMGAVKKEAVEKFTRRRIEMLASKLLPLEDGEFQFELDDLTLNGKLDIGDCGWELSKGMSPEYLLMEGARVHDEASAGVFSPSDEFEEGAEDAGWEETQWSPREARKDMSYLRALTQELRFPSSASEITLLILRFASEIFQRGVFFMVGDEEMVGLGQFGLEIDKADERIREIRLSKNKSPFLKGIIEEGRFYYGEAVRDGVTERMMKELGGQWPAKAALFPLIAEERVVALLYCDNLEEAGEIEIEGLEIFISQAGLALEKALLKRRLGELEKGGMG